MVGEMVCQDEKGGVMIMMTVLPLANAILALSLVYVLWQRRRNPLYLGHVIVIVIMLFAAALVPLAWHITRFVSLVVAHGTLQILFAHAKRKYARLIENMSLG